MAIETHDTTGSPDPQGDWRSADFTGAALDDLRKRIERLEVDAKTEDTRKTQINDLIDENRRVLEENRLYRRALFDAITTLDDTLDGPLPSSRLEELHDRLYRVAFERDRCTQSSEEQKP